MNELDHRATSDHETGYCLAWRLSIYVCDGDDGDHNNNDYNNSDDNAMLFVRRRRRRATDANDNDNGGYEGKRR